jgi:DNA-binding FrmR family transcriptional regulator
MARKGPSTVEDRLHRIEGQIRGIERMLEESQEIPKVITQIQAVISSLESVKIELVKDQVRESMLENIDEALKLLK